MRKHSLMAVTAAAVTVVMPLAAAPAQAAGATAHSDYGFVAKVEIGTPDMEDAQSCSGALLRPDLVVTSAACFTRKGAAGRDGLPPLLTTVTVGRPDLTATGGHAKTAARISLHPDRDVALVRFAGPAAGVATIDLASSAPTVGGRTRVAGYGRTRTEWVPTRQHAGDFTVANASSGAVVRLASSPDATVCQGDAGGPVFEESGGRPVLIAVASSGGQAGCLGAAADASTGVVGTRVDDLASWVQAAVGDRTMPPAYADDGEDGTGRWADFDGDGRDDYLVIAADGTVNAYLNRGGGAGGWLDRGKVANGVKGDPSRVRFADFDGDGKADFSYFPPGSGAVHVYFNRGGEGAGGWSARGQFASGAGPDIARVRFADFDGDGKADFSYFPPGSGAVRVHLNRGGDDAGGWVAQGEFASGVTSDIARVRFADFDGDRKADFSYFPPGSGAVHVYLNRGGDGRGGWSSRGKIASGSGTEITRVRFADFDGDGKADYLFHGYDSGPVHVFLNRGGDGAGGWETVPRIL